jgi:hypothetical protein
VKHRCWVVNVCTCLCCTPLQPPVVRAWRCLLLLQGECCHEIRSEEERAAAVAAVEKKMPRAVKRKRRVVTEDGIDAGMEEYLVCLASLRC